MKCPNDNETLVMSERSGIEIDYCPTCRGVWLDRGELDKLIERNSEQAVITPQEPVATPQYDTRENAEQEYRYNDSKYRKPKKKESFLGELFDF